MDGDVRKPLVPPKRPLLQKLTLCGYIYTFSRVTSCNRCADGSVLMITTDPTPVAIIRYLKIQKFKTLPNKSYVHIMRFNINSSFKGEDNLNFQKYRRGNLKYRIKQPYLLLWHLDKFIINKLSICTDISTSRIYVFMHVYTYAFINIHGGKTNRKKYSKFLSSRCVKQ